MLLNTGHGSTSNYKRVVRYHFAGRRIYKTVERSFAMQATAQ